MTGRPRLAETTPTARRDESWAAHLVPQQPRRDERRAVQSLHPQRVASPPSMRLRQQGQPRRRLVGEGQALTPTGGSPAARAVGGQ
mmetsp:Transcript_34738/g.86557  ORF Transcript_34738/g.86557 Transcript_34738/m.86557 type:complete len:86 (+) Transcript_34738:169-426(+)